jgi:uncharacterized protein (TIGR03435 family)
MARAIASLAVAGLAALTVPILAGMMNAPFVQAQSSGAARFQVASIKPASQQPQDVQGLGDLRMLPGGRVLAERVLLRYFIQSAYDLKPFQISGGPAWIDSAHYDIDAKGDANPSQSERRLMMQELLADRFKLKVHHETRQLPVYELTVAKSDPKLMESKEGSCTAPDPNASPFPPAPGQLTACGRIFVMMSPSGARLRGGQVSMTELVRVLSNVLGRTVVDKTGLQRTFDVQLLFTPDDTLGGLPAPPPNLSPSSDASRPAASPDAYGNLFAAIQDQLGLKLKSAKGPVDVLVIDSVERPSAN